MGFRLLVAFCLMLIGVSALTLPISLTIEHQDPYAVMRLRIRGARIEYARNDSYPSNAFTVEERWRVTLDPIALNLASAIRNPVWASTPAQPLEIPLLWLALIATIAVAISYAVRWRRISRRLKYGLCLKCGYDIRHNDVCPECATPRDAASQHRAVAPKLGRAIGIAGVMLFAVVLCTIAAIWWTGAADRAAQSRFRLRGMDVTRFTWETSPRLTGAVYSFRNSDDMPTAQQVDDAFSGRNLVLLDAGRFVLPKRVVLRDVAIVGRGPKVTTVHLNLQNAERVRLENVTIDCENSEFLSLRQGGSLSLKNCVVINYNSGAGGPNAVHGNRATLLVDGCVFDGTLGRASGHSFGNVFDMQGANRIYARDTIFGSNMEICRANCVTYDGCSTRSRDGNVSFQYRVSSVGAVFVRKSPTISSWSGPSSFELALDDPAFVDLLRQRGASTDTVTREVLKTLACRDDPIYWLALYRSGDPKLRSIATDELTRLNHPPRALVTTPGAAAVLVRTLKGDSSSDLLAARLSLASLPAEQIKTMLADQSLSDLQRRRLEEILMLRDLSVPLAVELEYSRIADEIERR